MRLTLTKQTEYALRALVWLAHAEETEKVPGDGLVARHKAAAISSAAGIPPVFAARVLAQLQRQGLLRARAGQQGGYTLARSPGDVSVLEVIEAVEGPLETRTCVLRDITCGTQGNCVLHDAWRAAQAALRDVLGRTTLLSALHASPNPMLDFGVRQAGPVVPNGASTNGGTANGSHVANGGAVGNGATSNGYTLVRPVA